VAVTIEADDPDLWIYHFERQVLNRLTFSSKSEHTPVWFPDGRRLAFVLDAPPFHIYSVSADGGSEPTPIPAARRRISGDPDPRDTIQ
jgi:Tol biopolymer transport system component